MALRGIAGPSKPVESNQCPYHVTPAVKSSAAAIQAPQTPVKHSPQLGVEATALGVKADLPVPPAAGKGKGFGRKNGSSTFRARGRATISAVLQGIIFEIHYAISAANVGNGGLHCVYIGENLVACQSVGVLVRRIACARERRIAF